MLFWNSGQKSGFCCFCTGTGFSAYRYNVGQFSYKFLQGTFVPEHQFSSTGTTCSGTPIFQYRYNLFRNSNFAVPVHSFLRILPGRVCSGTAFWLYRYNFCVGRKIAFVARFRWFKRDIFFPKYLLFTFPPLETYFMTHLWLDQGREREGGALWFPSSSKTPLLVLDTLILQFFVSSSLESW